MYRHFHNLSKKQVDSKLMKESVVKIGDLVRYLYLLVIQQLRKSVNLLSTRRRADCGVFAPRASISVVKRPGSISPGSIHPVGSPRTFAYLWHWNSVRTGPRSRVARVDDPRENRVTAETNRPLPSDKSAKFAHSQP